MEIIEESEGETLFRELPLPEEDIFCELNYDITDDSLNVPMGVEDVDSSIELDYEGCKDFQYIRELIQNAREAGATLIQLVPDLFHAAKYGVYRLMLHSAV